MLQEASWQKMDEGWDCTSEHGSAANGILQGRRRVPAIGTLGGPDQVRPPMEMNDDA